MPVSDWGQWQGNYSLSTGVDFHAGLRNTNEYLILGITNEGNVVQVLTNTSSLTDVTARHAVVVPAETLVTTVPGTGTPVSVRIFEISSAKPAATALTDPAKYSPHKRDIADALAFSNVGDVRDGKTANLFANLLHYLRGFFRSDYGPQLADRLEQLAKDFKEDMEDEEELSNLSISSLVSFLERNPGVKRPNITATPLGNLISQWRLGDNQSFSAHFLENGRVNYFVTFPNPRHPEQRDRATGNTTSDALFESAHLDSFEWLKHDRRPDS